MKHISIPVDQSCEFIEIAPSSNPLISKCLIKVCYVDDNPNRNGTVISKETAKKLAQGLPGSPIVGLFNAELGDFEEHNKILKFENGEWKLSDLTQPYGFVDVHAKVWFQKFVDDFQIEREYLVTEGYIWTGRYPETQRIIEKGNNQSMELDEKSLQGQWTKDENGHPRFFIINDGLISALCVLGENEEPCFEGSQINVNFSLGNTFYSMMEELKEIYNKGGLTSMDNVLENNVTVEETAEVVEETVEVVEEEVVVEETVEEEVVTSEENFVDNNGQEYCDNSEIEVEEVVETYSLEEIPEYQTLLADYAALQDSFNTLQESYSALETEVGSLREFKATIDTQTKQNMINSFYMLSEEDKKDVQDNIASYSLEEIESKLAVICVRNKVNFSLNEDTEETQEVTTFSIEQNAQEDSSDVPGWCKVADQVQKDLSI